MEGIFLTNEHTEESIEKAVAILRSENTSVSEKTRSLFYLRCLDTEKAALAIERCITGTSVLIDHEIAYILGQMKQEASITFLLKLMADTSINGIVRHEAIEALGNFEDESLIEKIEPYLSDENPIINESARLAIKKLKEVEEINIKAKNIETERPSNMNPFSKYHSRDPAFPFEGSFEDAYKAFKSDDIEQKYKAIFYFRDLNTEKAVEILAKGFKEKSDLLKHEIAYVFGQMQNPHSVKYLIPVLEDASEADIVRHEAAEALGNIGTDQANECLEKFLNSEVQIIKESANVGLGISINDEEDYSNIEKLSH